MAQLVLNSHVFFGLIMAYKRREKLASWVLRHRIGVLWKKQWTVDLCYLVYTDAIVPYTTLRWFRCVKNASKIKHQVLSPEFSAKFILVLRGFPFVFPGIPCIAPVRMVHINLHCTCIAGNTAREVLKSPWPWHFEQKHANGWFE